MLKDNDYFNDSLFNFINSEIKHIIKHISKQENKPIYFLLDEGLREVMKKRNIEFNKYPKKPVLVEENKIN